MKEVDDKQGYHTTLGNVMALLQKILPDDESKKNFVDAMKREPGSKDATLKRTLSTQEHIVVQTVIDSMANPELKQEANNILNEKTTLQQRLSKTFSAFMRFR